MITQKAMPVYHNLSAMESELKTNDESSNNVASGAKKHVAQSDASSTAHSDDPVVLGRDVVETHDRFNIYAIVDFFTVRKIYSFTFNFYAILF